jgi:hypothetical protein
MLELTLPSLELTLPSLLYPNKPNTNQMQSVYAK